MRTMKDGLGSEYLDGITHFVFIRWQFAIVTAIMWVVTVVVFVIVAVAVIVTVVTVVLFE